MARSAAGIVFVGEGRKMDTIWNLRFGRRTKEEVISPQAFSRDGYLINQGIIRQVRYGRRTTADTGCGWIACYNFLHYMKRTEDPLEIAHEMERMLLWGGFRGSHPLSLWIFLRRRGFRCRIAFTRGGVERILGRWEKERTDGQKIGGILSYKHRKGSHFAAFIKPAAGGAEGSVPAMTADAKGTGAGGDTRKGMIRYRFLNVIYGREHTEWTMREFFRDRVTFPVCFALLYRER